MRPKLFEMLSEGLRNPTSIPRFVRRKTAELGIIAKNVGVPSQRRKIKQLLAEDEFLLIILDACRFDTLRQTYGSHYVGDLTKVYSTNTATKQYQATTWPGCYDLTYVAGGPVISDRNFVLSDLPYRPSKHFREIVPAWDMGYAKELGVTPPEAVTHAALQQDDSRVVVHYFQPHAPYIGEVRLRDEDVTYESDTRSNIETRAESIQNIYGKIKSGAIERDDLRAAYESNLERAVMAMKPLIDDTKGTVVITSDHGELLGEGDRYLHGGLPHPLLCELPWLEVQAVKGRIDDPDVRFAESESRDKGVQEQLADLGYL